MISILIFERKLILVKIRLLVVVAVHLLKMLLVCRDQLLLSLAKLFKLVAR